MDLEEFSFMNQQLAAMLRQGLPLEGALAQLSRSLHRGQLRGELLALEGDLADGTPLREALAKRSLPPFYVRMVAVGMGANDLPGMLTLLADYYQQTNSVWTRLKGLLVYPLILLVGSLCLSVWLAMVVTSLSTNAAGSFDPAWSSWGQAGHLLGQTFVTLGDNTPQGAPAPAYQLWVGLWLPPLMLAVLSAGFLAVLATPRTRRWLRWRLPVFKEASLSQFAWALAILVRNGIHLRDALGLLRELERQTPLRAELDRWLKRCADGHSRFGEIAEGSRLFPPLFRWLVDTAGEDLATGLRRAAEVYQRRAIYRRELLIHGALPMSLIVVGFMVLGQVYPFTNYLYQGFRSFFVMSPILGR